MSGTNGQTWPAKSCRRAEAIQEAIDQTDARLSELIKTRQSLKADILKDGYATLSKGSAKASELVITLFSIEACRDRLKSLHDKLGNTIKNAHDTKMFEDDEEIDGREIDGETAFSLVQQKESLEEEDPNQMQFGEGGQAENSENRAKADGYTPGEGEPREDPIAKTSIKDLELEKHVEEALREARLTTIGKVEEFERGGAKCLEDLPGLGPASAAAIRKACKKHRKAAMRSV